MSLASSSTDFRSILRRGHALLQKCPLPKLHEEHSESGDKPAYDDFPLPYARSYLKKEITEKTDILYSIFVVFLNHLCFDEHVYCYHDEPPK
jgi:hypothetical protein